MVAVAEPTDSKLPRGFQTKVCSSAPLCRPKFAATAGFLAPEPPRKKLSETLDPARARARFPTSIYYSISQASHRAILIQPDAEMHTQMTSCADGYNTFPILACVAAASSRCCWETWPFPNSECHWAAIAETIAKTDVGNNNRHS